MLGSVAAAEDVAQEALLRLTRQEGPIDQPAAWITTVVTRLSINVLRSARARRESYVGPWLPEAAGRGPGARAGLPRRARGFAVAGLAGAPGAADAGRAGGLPVARGVRLRVRPDRRHHRADGGQRAAARDAGAQAPRGEPPALRRRRGRTRRPPRPLPRGRRGGRP